MYNYDNINYQRKELTMKKILVFKDQKKVLVKTVETIKQVNAIVELYKKKNCTVKVYSV